MRNPHRFRPGFARLLPLAVLTGLAAGTIARPAVTTPGGTRPQTIAAARHGTQSEKVEESDARDAAALETVLTDLLSYSHAPLEPEANDRKEILFSLERPPYPLPTIDVHHRHDSKQWEKLSPVQLAEAQQAVEALVRRVKAKEGFQPFKPKDRRVVTLTRKQEEERPKPMNPFRRAQVFHAYSPGYSGDGYVAIVVVTFPWSGGFHSGNATYELLRQNDRWVVLLRDFIFYV